VTVLCMRLATLKRHRHTKYTPLHLHVVVARKFNNTTTYELLQVNGRIKEGQQRPDDTKHFGNDHNKNTRIIVYMKHFTYGTTRQNYILSERTPFWFCQLPFSWD